MTNERIKCELYLSGQKNISGSINNDGKRSNKELTGKKIEIKRNEMK